MTQGVAHHCGCSWPSQSLENTHVKSPVPPTIRTKSFRQNSPASRATQRSPNRLSAHPGSSSGPTTPPIPPCPAATTSLAVPRITLRSLKSSSVSSTLLRCVKYSLHSGCPCVHSYKLSASTSARSPAWKLPRRHIFMK
ncbi:unnamed protein product [Closterium sp. NIES-54]